MNERVYGLPDTSTVTPTGLNNDAFVARSPSPLKVPVPVPANVEMTVVEAVILRMRLLPKSPM